MRDMLKHLLVAGGGLKIEAFTRALKEGQGQDKILGIFALGYTITPAAHENLLPYLQSSQPMEQWASALCLAHMGEKQALPTLLRMLTEFFPPKENLTSLANDLWHYNRWRQQIILLLIQWTEPEVIPALLDALQAYWHLEQAMPERNVTSRRYWRQCQERVMYTLGWLGHFEALPQMVKALGIVQPTLSSWRVFLSLGSRHAHKTNRDIFWQSIPRKSLLREQVMAVLHEQFGLSSEEQERCLDYYEVQQLW